MELSDPQLISSLLMEQSRPRKRPVRRGSPESVPPAPATRKPRRVCQCGRCTACADNARWDQIFNQKFADPDYYAPKPLAFGSSLGWLRRVS